MTTPYVSEHILGWDKSALTKAINEGRVDPDYLPKSRTTWASDQRVVYRWTMAEVKRAVDAGVLIPDPVRARLPWEVGK
jgi:hypothetical protein